MGNVSCVISSFITKPQRTKGVSALRAGCVISSFITKPQQEANQVAIQRGCVISSFITKPQPITSIILIFKVVYTTILYRKWVGDTLITRKITKKILIVLVLS